MIIDAKTIAVTLVVVVVSCFFGLRFVRSFALSIAKENHDAVLAMEAEEEKQRKREMVADEATRSAFAKVKPYLTGKGKQVAPEKSNSDGGSTVQMQVDVI